jgi:hypothetical protein
MDPEIEKRITEESSRLQNQIDALNRNNTIQEQSKNYGILFENLSNYIEPIIVPGATIATATGNNDTYFIAPRTLTVFQVDFSGTDALTTSDTNYITWTITNLGQDGAGSAAILAATDAETTKATGGSAIVADTRRELAVSSTLVDKQMVLGDRIRIRAAVTGTLANTVTFPVYLIQAN